MPVSDEVTSDRPEGDCQSVWCVVANVRKETAYGKDGGKVRRGSKHFAPGAKVYCFPPLWGDGYESIKVVGRHRKTHRYVTMVIESRYLENWRAELAYSPHVIRQFGGEWDGSKRSQGQAEQLASWKEHGSSETHHLRKGLLHRVVFWMRRALRSLVNRQ